MRRDRVLGEVVIKGGSERADPVSCRDSGPSNGTGRSLRSSVVAVYRSSAIMITDRIRPSSTMR